MSKELNKAPVEQAGGDERDSQQRVAIKAMEELAALRARVVVVLEPVTMDGTTTIREYVANAVPKDTPMDKWTQGYEECKRRIHAMFEQPCNKRLNGLTVSEGLLRGMAAFAQEIISGALEGGNFDGAELQESAERHGLIAKQVMNEPCRGPEEYCACAWSTSFPTECYRTTAELRVLLSQDKENGNG